MLLIFFLLSFLLFLCSDFLLFRLRGVKLQKADENYTTQQRLWQASKKAKARESEAKRWRRLDDELGNRDFEDLGVDGERLLGYEEEW